MSDPFAPIGGGKAKRATGAVVRPTMTVVMPVPEDAPAPPSQHPTLGRPTGTWRYLDSAGRLLGLVLRFDPPGRDKEFRPLSLREVGGKLEWQWGSWPAPRPLYGLQRLAENPTARVLVCEGERSADAAGRLLPGLTVLTSPNGSKSAAKADWAPLAGRAVIIWPDADTAGLDYARAVAKAATQVGAMSVVITSPPANVKVGWDAADAESEGWNEARTAALLAAAVPFKSETATRGGLQAAGGTASGGRRRPPPQRDELMQCIELVEYWHDPGRVAYATIPIAQHVEHWPIQSRDFKLWWGYQFRKKTGHAIGATALEEGLREIEALAIFDGPLHQPALRVGWFGGKLYIDMGDPGWRAIEVGPDEWKIIENVPIKFLRSDSKLALPEPEAGYGIEEFRSFVNADDDDYVGAVGWLVAAFCPDIEYPVLLVNGEHGSGKSDFCEFMRSIVDPDQALFGSLPKDQIDYLVSGENRWVLGADNLSGLSRDWSDFLCGISTGTGQVVRKKFTDREQNIFKVKRPLILNGIGNFVERPDFADRLIIVNLHVILPNARLPKKALLRRFDEMHGRILGAVLTGLSAAVRNRAAVERELETKELGRMGDAEVWITAAESGLGWERGTFSEVYHRNRRDAAEALFEADNCAVTIDRFMSQDRPDGFEDTAAVLLAGINAHATDRMRDERTWPRNASQMGNRLDRVAPLLRDKGYAVGKLRYASKRLIRIKRITPTTTIVPPP